MLSKLYSLEPIGIGTPFVEGFTSYITRLADAHCITVRELFHGISSEPDLPLQLRNYLLCNSFYKKANSLNSSGNIAKNMVSILQQLTLRDDLNKLSFVKWDGWISNISLIKKNKEWCPYCYQEWEEKGKELYDPLIWSISYITHCPIHNIVLLSQCTNPRCGSSENLLTGNSRTGSCSRCGFSKMKTSDTCGSEYEKRKIAMDWLFKTFGEIVSHEGNTEMPNVNISLAYEDLKKTYFNSDLKELSRVLQLDSKSYKLMYNICKGNHIPSFNIILWSCFTLGASLKGLMLNGSFTNLSINNKDLTYYIDCFNIKYRRYMDKQKVWEILEKYSFNHDNSLQFIADELCCDSSTLRKMFPEKCKLITSNYLIYRKMKSERLKMERFDEISEAVERYYTQNKTLPSERVLRSIPWNLKYLRAPVYKEHFKIARKLYESENKLTVLNE